MGPAYNFININFFTSTVLLVLFIYFGNLYTKDDHYVTRELNFYYIDILPIIY